MKKFMAFLKNNEVKVVRAEFGPTLCGTDGLFLLKEGSEVPNEPLPCTFFEEERLGETEAEALCILYDLYCKQAREAVDSLSKLEKLRHKIANAFMEESCKT